MVPPLFAFTPSISFPLPLLSLRLILHIPVRTTPSGSGVRSESVLAEGLESSIDVAAQCAVGRRGEPEGVLNKCGFALHGLIDSARLLDVASVIAMVSHDVLSIF